MSLMGVLTLMLVPTPCGKVAVAADCAKFNASISVAVGSRLSAVKTVAWNSS